MFRLAPSPTAGAGTVPIDLPAYSEISDTPLAEWRPPAKRSPLLPAILFLVIIVGSCLWILKDDLLPPLVAEIPAPQPSPAVITAPTPPAPLAPPPAAEPAPEIRRAELPPLPPVDLIAAGEAAQPMFLALLAAKTPAERAALIAQPEEYATDLEGFFAAVKPKLLTLKPSAATPHFLPGQQIVPLFQVTTESNPNGALLRLVPKPGGGFLLDWPLFAETHERRLAKFLEAKPADPAWFQVSLRRSHGLELPETLRSLQIALTLQGSADSSATCQAVVQKDTPLGRYLDRETEWSTIYIARLLLQHRKLEGGAAAIVILDCEGAATGSVR